MLSFKQSRPRRGTLFCRSFTVLYLFSLTCTSCGDVQVQKSSQLKPFDFRRQFRGPHPGENSPITSDPNYMQIVGTVGVSSGFSFDGQSNFRRASSAANNKPEPPKVIDFIAESNPNRGPGAIPVASPEIIRGKWIGPNRGPAAPASGTFEQSPFSNTPGDLAPKTANSPMVQVEFASPELVEGPWYRTPTSPTPEPFGTNNQGIRAPPAQRSSVHNKSTEIVEGPWIIGDIRKKIPSSPEWDVGPWILPSAISHTSIANTSMASNENRYLSLEANKNSTENTKNIEGIYGSFTVGGDETDFYDRNDNRIYAIQGSDLLGNQYFIEQPISTESSVTSKYNKSTHSPNSKVYPQFSEFDEGSTSANTDSVLTLAFTGKSEGVDHLDDSENFYTTEKIENNFIHAMPFEELTEKPSLMIFGDGGDEGIEFKSKSSESNNSSTSQGDEFKSSEMKGDAVEITQNPDIVNGVEVDYDSHVFSNNQSNSFASANSSVLQLSDNDANEYETEPSFEKYIQFSFENEDPLMISEDFVQFNDSDSTSFELSKDSFGERGETLKNDFFYPSNTSNVVEIRPFNLEATHEQVESSSRDNVSEALLVANQKLRNDEGNFNLTYANEIVQSNKGEDLPTSNVHSPIISPASDDSNLLIYASATSPHASVGSTPAPQKLVPFKHPTAISVVQGPSFGDPPSDKVQPAVAEARSPSKLPERLPYDKPHFPGLKNSQQENLHSLEDLFGRDTHEVNYFVGEKAEEMKRVQENTRVALMPPPALPLPILNSYEQFISNEQNENVPAKSDMESPAFQELHPQAFNTENNSDDVSLLSVLGYFGKPDDSQNRVIASSPSGEDKNRVHDSASGVQLNARTSKESREHHSSHGLSSGPTEAVNYPENAGATSVIFNPIEATENRVHDDTLSGNFSPIARNENFVTAKTPVIFSLKSKIQDYSDRDSGGIVSRAETEKDGELDSASDIEVSSPKTEKSPAFHNTSNAQLNYTNRKENRVHDGDLSVLFNPTGTKENGILDNTPRVLFRRVQPTTNLINQRADSLPHNPTFSNTNQAPDVIPSTFFRASESKEIPVDNNFRNGQFGPSETAQNSLRKNDIDHRLALDQSEENHVRDGDSNHLSSATSVTENPVQSNPYYNFNSNHHQLPVSSHGEKFLPTIPQNTKDYHHYSEQFVNYPSLSRHEVNTPSTVSTTESPRTAIVTELKPVYIHRESGDTSRTVLSNINFGKHSQNYERNNPVEEVLFVSDKDDGHDLESNQFPAVEGDQRYTNIQHQIQSPAQDRRFEVWDPQNFVRSSVSNNVKDFPPVKYAVQDETRGGVFAESHHRIKVQPNQGGNSFEDVAKQGNTDNSFNSQVLRIVLDAGDEIIEHNLDFSVPATEMLPPPALPLPMPDQVPQSFLAAERPVEVNDALTGNVVNLPSLSVRYDRLPNEQPSIQIPEKNYYATDTVVPPASHDVMLLKGTRVSGSPSTITAHSELSDSPSLKEKSEHDELNLNDDENSPSFEGKLLPPENEITKNRPIHPSLSRQQQRQPSVYSGNVQNEQPKFSGTLESQDDNVLHASAPSSNRFDGSSKKFSLSSVPDQQGSYAVLTPAFKSDDSRGVTKTMMTPVSHAHHIHKSSALEANQVSRHRAPQQSVYQRPSTGQSSFRRTDYVSQNLNFLRPPPPPPPSPLPSAPPSPIPPPSLPLVSTPTFPAQSFLPANVNSVAPGRYWNSHVRPPVTASRPPPFVLVPLNSPLTPSYELALRNFSPPPSLLHQFSLLRSSPHRPPKKNISESQMFAIQEPEATTLPLVSTTSEPAVTSPKSRLSEEISIEIQNTEAPKKLNDEPNIPTVVVALPIHENTTSYESENNFLDVFEDQNPDLSNLTSSRESPELLVLSDSSDFPESHEGYSFEGKSSFRKEAYGMSSVEDHTEKDLKLSVDSYNHRLGSDSKDRLSDSRSGSPTSPAIGESGVRPSQTGTSSSESHAPDTTLTAPQLSFPQRFSETRRKNSSTEQQGSSPTGPSSDSHTMVGTAHVEARFDNEYYDDGHEDSGHQGDGLREDIRSSQNSYESGHHFDDELRNDIRRLAALAIDAMNDNAKQPADGQHENDNDKDVYEDFDSLPETECWAFSDQELIINPGADVFIGVALPLSSSSEDSQSCGELQGPWVASLEALKWGLTRLNQARGQVGHRILSKSYVPGVKFGARVVDTCGRPSEGRSVMEIFYPQLSGVPHCPPPPALLAAGVINLSSQSAEVVPGLPMVEVNPASVVPAEDRARATLQVAAAQQWNRTVLLIERRSYHLNMAQLIARQSSSYNVCISAVEHLPKIEEDSSAVTYRDLLGRVRRLLRFGGLDGVVVVASGRVLTETLSAVATAAPHLRADVPWLLTDVPTAASAVVRRIVSAGLSLQLLTTMPPLAEFEKHWQHLPSVFTEETSPGDTFLQYVMQQTGCTLDLQSTDAGHFDCRSVSITDFDAGSDKVAGLDVIRRARTVVPTLHGLFTLAKAVHDAWRRKCNGRPGACRPLQALSLQEFYYSFLSGLEFDHLGPGARSPLGLRGGKQANDPAAQLAGSSLSVYRVLDIRGNITTALTMVLLGGGREFLNNSSSLQPPRHRKPPCFGKHCTLCLSRAPEALDDSYTNSRNIVPAEPHIFLPSPQDVYVVGMFAVHESSDDGTGCGPSLRAEAIQEVEAMLWAVQQINRHSQLLPSTQMGVVVLDTCGAQIRATNQVTNIIKETLPGLDIGLDNIYAFITSLDLDTAKVVGEMLASLNITSMNLGMSLAHSPFALQMSPPPNLEAEALVQILQYMGWDFVSMVVSEGHAPSTIAASALHTVARAARVCVGLELSLSTGADEDVNLQRVTKVVSRLVEFSSQGARAVLLFLKPSDAERLVTAVSGAQLSGLIDSQRLILISGTGWGDNTDQILAQSSPPGSVLLKDGQQDVQDFSLHYRLLTPQNNTKNPWFRDFWVQEFGCDKAICDDASGHPPVLPYRPTPPTPRVVQAVFSFGAAFTQLLHHLCPHASGHMCPGLAKWRRRTVLNEFLRNTEVSRVDKPREFFQFTENFHGNAPLEVLNVQRTPVRSALALPEIGAASSNPPQLNYIQVGRYFNGELSMKTPLAEAPNKRLVPLDSLPSSCTASCAAACTHRDTDYIFIESPDKVYIVAALNVHSAGNRPLECGPLRGDQGIQEVEAFLWALARANEASKQRPGTLGAGHGTRAPHIGAVIFDACSNKEKVVRDVTNLLTGRLQERIRKMLPSSSHIIGVVVGGRGEVPQQVLDITQPYGITSVTTLASHSHLSNTRRFPAVLHLAPSNYLKAAALSALLHRYDWSLFSIVYSDGGEAGDTAKHLLRDAAKMDLEAAVTEPIPLQVDEPTYMLEVWGRLAEGAQKGARAVLLLLQPPHLELFLLTGVSLRKQELLRQGDFVFLMTESPAPYLREPSFGLNTLVVQPAAGHVPDFADHFLGLSLLNHTSPYPWFAEFWAQVFGCQGASCLTGPPQTLGAVTRRLRISEGVPPTAGAVDLLAGALRSASNALCNQTTDGLCESLLTDPQFREAIFRAARARHGRIMDGQRYAFGDDGRNVEAVLQILNYREIGNTRIHTLVKVGEFSEGSGLLLNSSLALSYDSMGNPRPMTDVHSKCSNLRLCGKETPVLVEDEKTSLEATTHMPQNATEMNYIQIYPNKRFGISGLVPFHKKGKEFFTCGDYAGESIFQNLAAVAYALNQINSNTGEDLGLGAIFFDYCDRNERAREQMFSYYSGETGDNDPSVTLTPDKIVASLSFDDEAAESVSTILSSNYIPHFSSPVAGIMKGYRKDASIISSVPSRTAELHVYLSILREFNWKYVSVIFDNDSVGKYLAKTFKKLAKNVHICIGDTFGVHKIVSEEYAQELVEALSEEWKPRVIILLVDDASNIRTILEVAERMGKGDTFLFLAGRSWGNKADVLNGLDTIGSGALTFSLETYDLPDFRLFLANLTLDNHDPIPDSWFHDYYQNKFECRVSQAEKSVDHFTRECDGSEKIHADDIVQDPFVFHTILSVNAIAHGLDAYMRKQCKNVPSPRDCKIVQSEVLMEIAYQGRNSLNDSTDSSPYSQGGAYGYQLWNYRDIGGVYSYTSAGKWENGLINLDFKNIRFKAGDQFIPDSQCNEGPCVEVCASQSTVYAALRIPDPLPIDINFRSVYGITTATLSLVGVIVILVAIVYFMMTFPNAAGTSVLGYMILSGCLFIYASNFAFIFQPTVGTCAVRRSLMGIGYATAFASMLVKVMHTWRLSSSSDEENYISLTRPGVLFLVAVCLSLVQTILSAAWLILYPPAVDLLGKVWRCTPSEHFESDLVISLVYVMILMAATILFCLETWQYEENARETRWILLSSLLCVVCWLVWTIVATKAPISLRDPAIVIGNLSCATVIVLFLYARKLYLASQLSKDVRDLELRSHFTAASSVYNASLAAQKMGADQTQDNAQKIDLRLQKFDEEEEDDEDFDEVNSSGRQFVGDQEVSFKKVTLPPECRPRLSKAPSFSGGAPRPASRKSLGLTFSDEIPVNFKFNDYASSEDIEGDDDDFIIDASDLISDGENSNLYDEDDDVEYESRDEKDIREQDEDNRNLGPAIRRIGSRQMLVFLNDGHLGNVSRI